MLEKQHQIGKFSIEATRCIGACGLAPVFKVNEEVYGKATPEMIDKVIDEYMNKEWENPSELDTNKIDKKIYKIRRLKWNP